MQDSHVDFYHYQKANNLKWTYEEFVNSPFQNEVKSYLLKNSLFWYITLSVIGYGDPVTMPSFQGNLFKFKQDYLTLTLGIFFGLAVF